MGHFEAGENQPNWIVVLFTLVTALLNVGASEKENRSQF